MKYQAFISYNHNPRGRQVAIALESSIKSYAHSPFSKHPDIFRDEKFIVPTNDLSKTIKEGLDHSEYLIFIAEPQSAKSIWCQKELEYWFDSENRKDKFIIVKSCGEISENDDQIDWLESSALPLLLKKHITVIPFYIDFTGFKTTEQLSLENPDFNTKINAIVAKLRNLDPQDLNDEHIRIVKKNKRLRYFAIISLVLLTTISILLAIISDNRRLEVVKQFNIAKANELSAISRTKFTIDPTIAFETLIQAEKIANTPEVRSAFHDLLMLKDLNLYTRVDTIVVDTSISLAYSSNNRYKLFSSTNEKDKIYSPDFEFYYCSSDSNTSAILFDQFHRKEIARLKHDDLVSNCLFLNDTIFLTSGYDGLIKYWNLEGDLIDSINFDSEKITCVCNSASKYIYAGALSGKAMGWKVNGNVKIFEHEFNSKITVCDALEKEHLVLFGERNGTIIIFDTSKDQIYNFPQFHDDDITFAKFVNDSIIVSAGSDNKILVTNFLTKEIYYYCLGNDSDVFYVDYDIKNRIIRSIDENGIVKKWYLKVLVKNELLPLQHLDPEYMSANIAHAKNRIFFGRDVDVISTDTNGVVLASFYTDELVTNIDFNKSKDRILISGYVDTVFNLTFDLAIYSFFSHNKDETVFFATFIMNDSKVVTASDESIKLWSIEGEFIDSISSDGLVTDIKEIQDKEIIIVSDQSGNLKKISFTDDKLAIVKQIKLGTSANTLEVLNSKQILIGSDSLYLYNINDFKKLKSYTSIHPINYNTGESSEVFAIDYSSNDDLILVRFGDASLRVLDLDGNLIQSLQLNDISWSTNLFNDGKMILSYSLANNPEIIYTLKGLKDLMKN